MKIRYTSHSLMRMRQRNITRAEVKEAMKNGRKHPASDGLRESRLNRGQKGILSVIYKIRSLNEVTIITAYIS